MGMTPRSCRTPSAAIVAGAHAQPQRPSVTRRGRRAPARGPRRPSPGARPRRGRRTAPSGVVDEARMFGSPASASRSGAWPPPQPSMWKAWTVRPPKAASVSSTDSASLRPSVWIASCTSWRSADVERASICGRRPPTSSWIFSPRAAGAQPLLHRLRAGRRAAHEGPALSGTPRGPPRSRRAPRRVVPEVPHRAEVLDHQRRDPAGQRGVGDLRRQPVHVRVDGARRDDQPGRVEDRGRGVEHDLDPVHRVGVAGAADGDDRALRTIPMLVRRTPRTGSSRSPPRIASSTPPRLGQHAEPVAQRAPKPGSIASGPPASSASGDDMQARCRRGGPGSSPAARGHSRPQAPR